jgi:hypothetical protein
MPHLHLPIDHTDDDLVLAANVAEVVGSADLYVTWSHEGGAGAVPEVEAVVRHERPGTRFAALRRTFIALARTIFGRPTRPEARPAPSPEPRPTTPPSTSAS